MIHGKKRNEQLMKRLMESWGYSKSDEEVVPLDEEMAADSEDEVVEEAEEDEELEEGGRANRKENESEGDERRMGQADRMREDLDAVPVEDEDEEGGSDAAVEEGVYNRDEDEEEVDEEETETEISELEETIRKVVQKVLSEFTTK